MRMRSKLSVIGLVLLIFTYFNCVIGYKGKVSFDVRTLKNPILIGPYANFGLNKKQFKDKYFTQDKISETSLILFNSNGSTNRIVLFEQFREKNKAKVEIANKILDGNEMIKVAKIKIGTHNSLFGLFNRAKAYNEVVFRTEGKKREALKVKLKKEEEED